MVGRPLHADKMTESKKRISFARICIEVGVEDTLPGSFELELETGEVIEIRVEYNWVPEKCMLCREFGHLTKNCRASHQEWIPKNSTSMEGASVEERQTGEGWEEVKRRGKKVFVDRSPSPVKSAGAATSNPFAALESDEVADSLALAIVPDSRVDPSQLNDKTEHGIGVTLEDVETIDGKEGFSTPVVDGQLMVQNVTYRDHSLRADDSFSDSSSIPMNNPLIQKVHLIDEVEKKRKKAKKKEVRKGGLGDTPGRFSS